MARRAQRWKLLGILQQTSAFFAARDIDQPRLQAEILLADVLNLRRLDLYLQFERPLSHQEISAYREHVRKRLTGQPVQYITGEAGFRQQILQVSPSVLIPRPETEILVQFVLDRLNVEATPHILDLGCGSGAIAVALADECSSSRIIATDISAEALAVAATNVKRQGLCDRIALRQGDLFDSVTGEYFDAIVANPPYVASKDIDALSPEVRNFEPWQALDGGKDGLDFYRLIASTAVIHLNPGGFLALEMGAGQSLAISRILTSNCWAILAIHPDLNGIPRVVLAVPTSP